MYQGFDLHPSHPEGLWAVSRMFPVICNTAHGPSEGRDTIRNRQTFQPWQYGTGPSLDHNSFAIVYCDIPHTCCSSSYLARSNAPIRLPACLLLHKR